MQARSLVTLEKILAAAEALVLRGGAASLTLEAVAKEARISKGGVQHHFRSKEALIAALVAGRLEMLEAETQKEEAALAGEPQSILRAMIRSCAYQYKDDTGFPAALLLAAFQNSDSLQNIKRSLSTKHEQIKAQGARPAEASMLIFACLGLLMSRTLGFSFLSDKEALDAFVAAERAASRSDWVVQSKITDQPTAAPAKPKAKPMPRLR